MIINETIKTEEVHEWDFILDNGMTVPLTLKPATGDSIEEKEDAFYITISAKPHPTHPDVVMPEERNKIFKSHILIVQHRVRTLSTPEDVKRNLASTLRELAAFTSTIQ